MRRFRRAVLARRLLPRYLALRYPPEQARFMAWIEADRRTR